MAHGAGRSGMVRRAERRQAGDSKAAAMREMLST